MKRVLQKKHFDRAVKQSWSVNTCIIAQLAIDNGDLNCTHDSIPYDRRPYNTAEAGRIMGIFDRNFQACGDENQPVLQELRASLPITL